MAKRIKKKTKIEDRFRNMSPEESALRWRQMRPRYLAWLGLFILVFVSTYLANHGLVMQYGESLREHDFLTKVVGVLNVAFQISSIFCCLFISLVSMSYIFGRTSVAASTH